VLSADLLFAIAGVRGFLIQKPSLTRSPLTVQLVLTGEHVRRQNLLDKLALESREDLVI
jgi:hypothetical protein